MTVQFNSQTALAFQLTPISNLPACIQTDAMLYDIFLMKQPDNLSSLKLQEIEQRLSKSQLSIKFALRKYQNFHNQLAVRAKLGYDNNQNLLSIFVKVTSTSFKPIQLILRFIEDADVLNLASTCQSMYRMIYSPLGYRIIRSLRPVLVKVRKEREMPTFNKVYLENLCSEVNMLGMDQDDRVAIIQTMRTNLMAARQKLKEIEKCNLEWDRKKMIINEEIMKAIHAREKEQRRIDQIHDQIEKLNELLQQSADNISKLKQEQAKMLNERQSRKRQLQSQRQKLTRQKDLLIKKIKSQQKQREEGLIYAREVGRVTSMLDKLTSKR